VASPAASSDASPSPARRPAVLLLDEPTAGLYPHLRDEIGERLRHLAERHRIAIALSCHDAAP
jgi:peptide/nickel transport system ATP-binding protein